MMEMLECRTLFSYVLLAHVAPASSSIAKISAPSLNAKATDVPIDPIEISQESMTLVSTTPSSTDPKP
jgi:hypothetical protein